MDEVREARQRSHTAQPGMRKAGIGDTTKHSLLTVADIQIRLLLSLTVVGCIDFSGFLSPAPTTRNTYHGEGIVNQTRSMDTINSRRRTNCQECNDWSARNEVRIVVGVCN